MEEIAQYYLNELFDARLTDHNSLIKLKTKSRKREIVEAKYAIYWLIRRDTKISVEKIGRFFYNDHSTVCHGVSVIWDKENSPIRSESIFFERLRYIRKFPSLELTIDNTVDSRQEPKFENPEQAARPSVLAIMETIRYYDLLKSGKIPVDLKVAYDTFITELEKILETIKQEQSNERNS